MHKRVYTFDFDQNHDPPFPAIQIGISTPEQAQIQRQLTVLVDSGSDGTLLPLDVLKAVGASYVDHIMKFYKIRLFKISLIVHGKRIGRTMRYYGRRNDDHTAPALTGVLLINVGTPTAPTAQAVRPYLRQFLGDPRVIEYPRWLWWLILNGIILNTRPRRSARLYSNIWTAEGSPLLANLQRQETALWAELEKRTGVAVS